MKPLKLTILLMCTVFMAQAQTKNVGINTTAPKATLDVDLPSSYASGDQAGISVPTLTGDQIEAMTTTGLQAGTLVYATSASTNGADVKAPGFWYWTAGTDNWEPFLSSSAEASAGWSIDGNAGTSDATNFLGTTDNVGLKLRTNNTEHVVVTSTGNVGVGELAPTRKFEVEGGESAFRNNATTGANVVIGAHDQVSYVDYYNDDGVLKSNVAYGEGLNALSINAFSTNVNTLINPLSGNVGIGESVPGQKLVVKGDTYHPVVVNATNTADPGGGGVTIHPNDFDGKRVELSVHKNGNFRIWANGDRFFIDRTSGNVGVSTLTPDEKLHVDNGKIKVSETGFDAYNAKYARHYIDFLNGNNVVANIFHNGANGELVLNANHNNSDFAINLQPIGGSVGVNGIDKNYSFFVNGNAKVAGQFWVGGTQVPDYVFEKYYDGESELNPAYEFKSLRQVEAFIKKNGHLPGYDSALKVKENGAINLSKNHLLNMEKVEELYLHTIEQEKRIKAQQELIQSLMKRVEALESH